MLPTTPTRWSRTWLGSSVGSGARPTPFAPGGGGDDTSMFSAGIYSNRKRLYSKGYHSSIVVARNGANGENRGVYVYLIHTNEETRKVMQIRQEAEWKMPKIRRLSEDRTKESGGSSRRSKGMESDARCFDVRHRPRVRCGSYLGTNHQARRLFFFRVQRRKSSRAPFVLASDRAIKGGRLVWMERR